MFGTNPNVHQTKNPQSYNFLLSFCMMKMKSLVTRVCPVFCKLRFFSWPTYCSFPIHLPLHSCYQIELTPFSKFQRNPNLHGCAASCASCVAVGCCCASLGQWETFPFTPGNATAPMDRICTS